MYLPIMIDPLFAGERKPIAAKTMRKKAQIISCNPVPTITCAFFLIVFAAIGFLSPANRGSIMIGKYIRFDEQG